LLATARYNNITRSCGQNAQIDSGHLFEMLLARNRIIVMELQNLMITIALAKINVVCANILDHANLERKNLSVASVKVLQSPNNLHFVPQD